MAHCTEDPLNNKYFSAVTSPATDPAAESKG